MSIGLVSVPFFNIMNFSNTWGIGLKGAKSMNTAKTIKIEYGILSRKANVISFADPACTWFYHQKDYRMSKLRILQIRWPDYEKYQYYCRANVSRR